MLRASPGNKKGSVRLEHTPPGECGIHTSLLFLALGSGLSHESLTFSEEPSASLRIRSGRKAIPDMRVKALCVGNGQ